MKRLKNSEKIKRLIFVTALTLAIVMTASCCTVNSSANINTTISKNQVENSQSESASGSSSGISLASIPSYTGSPYTILNDNKPNFPDSDFTTTSFESYSELDELGRCGTAFANVGSDLMPTESRESIYEIKPTGWHSVKYDFIDGESLYNRCHLIAHTLTGENANAKNLITGTRYMNTEGMNSFENMTADYIRETKNHVLYRVTPLFDGDNLLVTGVEMEAESVEDRGEGVLFHVFCYNVQPGIIINYANGDNSLEESVSYSSGDASSASDTSENTYILNTNTKKFHRPGCSGAATIKEKNKKEYTGSREDLIAKGYKPCPICNP